jgi:uncharacterized protein YecT (DUF1311 family)
MRIALAFAAAALVTSASAQDITCNAEGSTMEMAACANDDFEKADKELNAVYQRLLAQLKKDDAEYGSGQGDADTRVLRLRASQRAWIAWRDAECPLRSIDNFGGSIERIEWPACTADLTRERTKQLQALLGG